tara:strand:- start:473 stop:2140 length:1668 start_codon:yes stop_codon:yes gene_type:complete
MKYIRDYNNYKLLKEEFKFLDTLKNLFKSDEQKSLEKNITDWIEVTKKFKETFKNEKWEDIFKEIYLSKYEDYYEIITSWLSNIYKGRSVYFPFDFSDKDVSSNIYKLAKGNSPSLWSYKDNKKIDLKEIKEIITNFFKAHKEYKDNIELCKKTSKEIEKFLKETCNDNFKKIENFLKNSNDEIYIEDPYKKIWKYFYLTEVVLIDVNDLDEEKLEEFDTYDNKKNKLENLNNIIDNLKIDDVKNEINNTFEKIELIYSIREKILKENPIFEKKLSIIKSYAVGENSLSMLPEKYTTHHERRYSYINRKLGINPSELVKDGEFISDIDDTKKIIKALEKFGGWRHSPDNWEERQQTLLNKIDEIPKLKDDYYNKISISVEKIIKDNKLNQDNIVYFTHSGFNPNLTIDNLNMEPDNKKRGTTGWDTPEDRYGFYLTIYDEIDETEFDAEHYYRRSKVIRNSSSKDKFDEPIVYKIDLDPNTKLLDSTDIDFSQTNSSTKEFGEYIKSLGFKGFYNPHPYGKNESTLEIVIVDKSAITKIERSKELENKIKKRIEK